MDKSSSLSERVTIEIADGVAEVTLNRPDKLNALDPAMFEAIIAAGENLSQTAGLRAIVLAGAGKGFCAGLDKETFASLAGEGAGAWAISRNVRMGSPTPSSRRLMSGARFPFRSLRRSMGSHWAAAFRSPLAPTSATSRRTRASRSWKSNGASSPTWAELRSCASSPAPMLSASWR